MHEYLPERLIFFNVVFVVSMLQMALAPLLPNRFSEISCKILSMHNIATVLVFTESNVIMTPTHQFLRIITTSKNGMPLTWSGEFSAYSP